MRRYDGGNRCNPRAGGENAPSMPRIEVTSHYDFLSLDQFDLGCSFGIDGKEMLPAALACKPLQPGESCIVEIHDFGLRSRIAARSFFQCFLKLAHYI